MFLYCFRNRPDKKEGKKEKKAGDHGERSGALSSHRFGWVWAIINREDCPHKQPGEDPHEGDDGARQQQRASLALPGVPFVFLATPHALFGH
jgi:hypothetical protein